MMLFRAVKSIVSMWRVIDRLEDRVNDLEQEVEYLHRDRAKLIADLFKEA